ncbi:MAG: DJ-1/PfpI family protein [Clostridia bacterium]|nr:DJ-1/PfpI family protein [Clostridia bacterium]
MIYVFLADGFEETEAIAPIDILRRAELEVKTVALKGDRAESSHGVTVLCDMNIKDITTEDMDAIVLPGGMPGTLNLEANPIVRVCIDYCYNNGKLIGAICAAPSILGHLGLLKGKNAVCFPGFENELTGAVIPENELVVKDGNIITAKGAGVALEFGLALAKELAGDLQARKIKAAIQMRKN